MVWQKAWLDTRWRFVTGLALLVVLACGTVIDYRAVQQLVPQTHVSFDATTRLGRALQEAIETERDFRGFIWWQWFRQNLAQLWTLFAILLGAGGLLARSAGDGALFTLALPASRRQLLGGRIALGLAELAALAVVPSLVIVLMSPAIGEQYSIVDALVHGACLLVAGSSWYVLTILLSTIFRDVWRPMLLTGALVLLAAAVEFSSGVGPFQVMNATRYFRAGQLPWIGLALSTLTMLALWYAADRNYERQDM